MKPETKREILIARAAFAEALSYPRHTPNAHDDAIAAKRYPLPKITRARVIRDRTNVAFTTGNSTEIWFRHREGDGWRSMSSVGMVVDAERAAIFHDLFQNPTEEVEDDS